MCKFLNTQQKMNIFFLSLNPSQIARRNCDQHVIKIQLEICQMLYTAWHFSNQSEYVSQHAPYNKNKTQRGYKPAHAKHPMTMWIASSLENYKYACEIGIQLTLEYTKRFHKVHTCAKHLLWLYNHVPDTFEERKSPKAYYSKEGIPECMPEEYHCENIIDAYKMYYKNEKMKFARYTIPS